MRWFKAEYLLKGIYLGFLVFVALQEPGWRAVGWMTLCTFGGLAVALGVAAQQKLKLGFQVKDRLAAFILFLLLESRSLVYAGVLCGSAVGALIVGVRIAEDLGLLAGVLA